jgi:hypothetical protein
MKIEDALKQLVAPGSTWRDGSDFWKALCLLCHREAVSSEADLTRVTNRFEANYKDLTGATSMPGKYRSAKSVLTKALALKIPYADRGGIPRGKTAVERDFS